MTVPSLGRLPATASRLREMHSASDLTIATSVETLQSDARDACDELEDGADKHFSCHRHAPSLTLWPDALSHSLTSAPLTSFAFTSTAKLFLLGAPSCPPIIERSAAILWRALTCRRLRWCWCRWWSTAFSRVLAAPRLLWDCPIRLPSSKARRAIKR